MNLQECLPAELRGGATTITRIGAGLSGAGVYRVEADGRAFVLKVAADGDLVARWPNRRAVLELAAAAGLAPRIVHVDDERRAVVSELVIDRSFPAFYGDPRTRGEAVALLGRTLRRVHDLPLPAGATPADPRDFLAQISSQLLAGTSVPPFVADAIRRVLAEAAPDAGWAPVLCHNDVNPSNLAFDGDELRLLDWDAAGVGDPYYDLGAIALFLRMDDATCLQLLGAHDGAPVSSLPPRFAFNRRIVGVLCGSLFLQLARVAGHAGATGSETLESTAPLSDIYQRMRAGTLDIATADGKWAFGLALVKAAG